MLKILEFIFQDFLHWIGTVILLSVVCGTLSRIVYIDKRTVYCENKDEMEKICKK